MYPLFFCLLSFLVTTEQTNLFTEDSTTKIPNPLKKQDYFFSDSRADSDINTPRRSKPGGSDTAQGDEPDSGTIPNKVNERNNSTLSKSYRIPTREKVSKQQHHPNPLKFTRVKRHDPLPNCIKELKYRGNNINDFIIYHFIFNSDVLELLVMVESLPQSFTWRQSIRSTWKISQTDVSIVFVIPTLGANNMDSLIEESKTYKDIILFKLVGTFDLGSGKLIHYLHWCHILYKYHYLLRTHDNFYIRVNAILKKLHVLSGQQELYMGYFRGNRNINTNDTHWFLCPSLVPHADIGAYILSQELISRFLKQFWYLNYYNSEGASVGLWVSPFKDVTLEHDINFDSGIKGYSRGCRNSFLVTPTINEDDMKERYNRLNSDNSFCQWEFDREKSYQYDWSNLPSQCCDHMTN